MNPLNLYLTLSVDDSFLAIIANHQKFLFVNTYKFYFDLYLLNPVSPSSL